MMQTEGTRMTAKDRRELERNIAKLSAECDKYVEEYKTCTDKDDARLLRGTIASMGKELRRLRRLR